MNRVNELQIEHAQLNTALADLEAQHKAIDAGLDSLYAQAERNPSEATQNACQDAEGEKAAIEVLLRRKRAALTACESDLAGARVEAEQQKRVAVIEELREIHADYARVAHTLDANISLLGEWERLTALANRGNALYRKNGLYGDSRRELFMSPHHVIKIIMHALQTQVEHATGLARSSLTRLPPSEALEVHATLSRINRL